MNETMTPHDAARVLAEAARYEDALAERTGGITWMIWGLAGPAIFLSYALAEAAGLPAGPLWGFLWAPWVVGGLVATGVLWRSAALVAPSLQDEPSLRIWARWIGGTAALTLAMFLVPATSANEPLVLIGLFWVAMGALDLFRAPLHARLVAVVAGIALLGVALALVLLGVHGLASDVAAAFASGVVPFVAGLYHTLRR